MGGPSAISYNFENPVSEAQNMKIGLMGFPDASVAELPENDVISPNGKVPKTLQHF